MILAGLPKAAKASSVIGYALTKNPSVADDAKWLKMKLRADRAAHMERATAFRPKITPRRDTPRQHVGGCTFQIPTRQPGWSIRKPVSTSANSCSTFTGFGSYAGHGFSTFTSF